MGLFRHGLNVSLRDCFRMLATLQSSLLSTTAELLLSRAEAA